MEEGEEEKEETLKPMGVPYKDDASTPVFSWNQKAYSCTGLVKLLLQEYEKETFCISQPVNVAHNVTFPVENKMLKRQDDVKCDDMGVWKHTGSPAKWFAAKKDENNVVMDIQQLNGKPGPEDDDVYQL